MNMLLIGLLLSDGRLDFSSPGGCDRRGHLLLSGSPSRIDLTVGPDRLTDGQTGRDESPGGWATAWGRGHVTLGGDLGGGTGSGGGGGGTRGGQGIWGGG